MKRGLCLVLILLSSLSFAADRSSLSNLFKKNFNQFYQPRMCGNNIALLVSEASSKNIDLSNSYVLKVEGAGFLETSGFYTRKYVNKRAMLGYFHFVYVADGYVFDFDLAEPLILKLEDYIRLQFTPPYVPYEVFGVIFDPLDELSSWKVTRYEWDEFLSSGPQKTWTKPMGELINLERTIKRKRMR